MKHKTKNKNKKKQEKKEKKEKKGIKILSLLFDGRGNMRSIAGIIKAVKKLRRNAKGERLSVVYIPDSAHTILPRSKYLKKDGRKNLRQWEHIAETLHNKCFADHRRIKSLTQLLVKLNTKYQCFSPACIWPKVQFGSSSLKIVKLRPKPKRTPKRYKQR